MSPIRSGGIVSALAAVLLLSTLAATPGPTSAGEADLEGRLRAGRSRLEEFDYAGSIARFDEVVRLLQDGGTELGEAARARILTAALEGRAVAHLGAGDERRRRGGRAFSRSTGPG